MKNTSWRVILHCILTGQVEEETKALHKKAKKEKSELCLGPSSGGYAAVAMEV